MREDDQAGCFAVDAVNRCQGIDAELALEAHQQGLLHIAPRRCDRQKMRLVGDDEMLILEQHDFIEGDARLGFKRAVVENAQACLVGPLIRYDHAIWHPLRRLPACGQARPAADTAGRRSMRNAAAMLGHEPRRQDNAARADTVPRRQWRDCSGPHGINASMTGSASGSMAGVNGVVIYGVTVADFVTREIHTTPSTVSAAAHQPFLP